MRGDRCWFLPRAVTGVGRGNVELRASSAGTLVRLLAPLSMMGWRRGTASISIGWRSFQYSDRSTTGARHSRSRSSILRSSLGTTVASEGIWDWDEPSVDEIPSQSDTLSSSSVLIDTTVVDGKTFQSGATVLPQGPLTAVIKAIDSSVPQPEYNKASKTVKAAHH